MPKNRVLLRDYSALDYPGHPGGLLRLSPVMLGALYGTRDRTAVGCMQSIYPDIYLPYSHKYITQVINIFPICWKSYNPNMHLLIHSYIHMHTYTHVCTYIYISDVGENTGYL